KMTLVPGFIVMAVVLILRPYGLFGRPVEAPRGGHPEMVVRPAPRPLRRTGAAALFLPLVAPLLLGDYGVSVLTEIVIFVLVAASLHFIMGPGGMHSFGHAAYFGIGAYAAAMTMKYLGAPMSMGLLISPVVAGLLGLVLGWFCVRVSGVYLAMLTLAFAQIVWSIAFQWNDVTGGENGILDVWPAQWASSKEAFFYLTAAICIAGTLLLRRIIFAPFGYAMRAGRDSPIRAETIGINVPRVQWV